MNRTTSTLERDTVTTTDLHRYKVSRPDDIASFHVPVPEPLPPEATDSVVRRGVIGAVLGMVALTPLALLLPAVDLTVTAKLGVFWVAGALIGAAIGAAPVVRDAHEHEHPAA